MDHRLSLVFKKSDISEELQKRLDEFVKNERELLNAGLSYCSIKMFDDILIDDETEDVVLATIIVLQGAEVLNLLEIVYDFASDFPSSVLPRYEHSKYNLKDINGTIGDE